MASLIDNLITTLNTENDEYTTLLNLSIEKTGIIVKGDVDGLNNMVEREQEVSWCRQALSQLSHGQIPRKEIGGA